jgi:hypothetical protein
VDANDALDSESAAANGVALRQLLWVRCKSAGSTAKPWARLDQSLRATDLLLQAGGFSAIVLDLGLTAPEHAIRIPLATWFRFRQTAHRTRCSLLVLGLEPLAQSSAAVVLECAQLTVPSGGQTVLGRFRYQIQTGRVASNSSPRSMDSKRKPPASTWSTTTAWDRERRA